MQKYVSAVRYTNVNGKEAWPNFKKAAVFANFYSKYALNPAYKAECDQEGGGVEYSQTPSRYWRKTKRSLCELDKTDSQSVS